MRITDENGKRVVTPDGISDDWLFFDETLLEDNERVELYPTLERPDKERAKIEDSLTGWLIDLDKIEVKAMPLEMAEETLQFYQMVRTNREQTAYLEDLRGAGVFEAMPESVKSLVLQTLHLYILTAIDNISKPATAKSDICFFIEQLDALTGRPEKYCNITEYHRGYTYNCIVNSLASLGLVRWLEAIDVKRGGVGYYEHKSLLDWAERLVTTALLDFCQYKTFDVAGETDGNTTQLLEVLRRVCAYLCGTKVGKDVQGRIRRVILGESVAETTDTQTYTPDTQTDTPEGKALPDELNTKKGRGLLQSLIRAGYCNNKYYWNSDKWASGRDLYALACFVVMASDYLKLTNKLNKDGTTQTRWKPFEDLFEFRGKRKNKAGIYAQIQQKQKDCQKEGLSLQDLPEYKVFSKFFEGLHTSTPQQ